MQQFEISTMTLCDCTSVNVRTELHGEVHVPAVDVGLRLTAANDVLTQFDGALKAMLYGNKGGSAPAEGAQGEIDGIDPITDLPNLRSHVLEQPVKLATEGAGYTMTIEVGLGQLVVEKCEVKKFRANCLEGGTVELSFQVQAAGVDEATVGKLAMMLGNKVNLTLRAPVLAVQEKVPA